LSFSSTANSPQPPTTSCGSMPVSSLMSAATRAARAWYDLQSLQWRMTISSIGVTSSGCAPFNFRG
jgi:hypothetical protein